GIRDLTVTGVQTCALPIFLEHVVEAVARRLRAQVAVERRDQARRDAVLGRAHGDPGRERGDRLVADLLVDELRGAPERLDVDARSEERRVGKELRSR